MDRLLLLPRSIALTTLLLLTSVSLLPCAAQTPSAAESHTVYTVADTLVGAVGGVAVDGIGTIYVADFRESVWKVLPDGRTSRFATGLYGASGNTIDAQGNLFQANFSGHYISKIDRHGTQEIYVAEGLNGPVGIDFGPDGHLYVNNCQGNTISRVTPERAVSTFAESPLFNCPNGLTVGPDSNLYVVNFRDEKMLKVTPDGAVSEFATLPGGGNGHVAVARGALYATSFRGQRIYRVDLDGTVTLVAGTGQRGEQDGAGSEATFSWPNGIAAAPTGDRLYVNDFLNRFPPTVTEPPVPLSSVRMLKLPSISDLMAQALRSGGIAAMEEAYHTFKDNPANASLYTEIEVNRFGYALMQQDQLQAAIVAFKLNVESYPNSFNVYDSLAEAYMNDGQTERAIQFYEKSLEINPGNTNAKEMLAKLRGE
ncbi:MAG: tetratricopeptide repeat protein [Bacteroidetes bacterium]|jgi:sugar lactone lactonase YvrE|nr:tetratricopeptide repeat protein [Bacteroidota bacterium]